VNNLIVMKAADPSINGDCGEQLAEIVIMSSCPAQHTQMLNDLP
jgi:hypothetical protein